MRDRPHPLRFHRRHQQPATHELHCLAHRYALITKPLIVFRIISHTGTADLIEKHSKLSGLSSVYQLACDRETVGCDALHRLLLISSQVDLAATLYNLDAFVLGYTFDDAYAQCGGKSQRRDASVDSGAHIQNETATSNEQRVDTATSLNRGHVAYDSSGNGVDVGNSTLIHRHIHISNSTEPYTASSRDNITTQLQHRVGRRRDVVARTRAGTYNRDSGRRDVVARTRAGTYNRDSALRVWSTRFNYYACITQQV